MVTIGEATSSGGEASVNLESFIKSKTGAPVIIDLAYSFIGVVGSVGHIDTEGENVGMRGEGILEVKIGIGPRSAVVVAGGSEVVDVGDEGFDSSDVSSGSKEPGGSALIGSESGCRVASNGVDHR